MFRPLPSRCGLFLILAVMAWSVTVSASPQSQSPDAASKEPFEADARLEIPPIHSTLRVAEPNEIPIVLHGSGLLKILSLQQSQQSEGIDPYGMTGGEQTPSLLHHADASAYVNIVPIRLGKLRIQLIATFADGGIADQAISVDVGPSKIAPAALGQFGNLLLPNGLFIDSTHPSPSYISPVAYYIGLLAPILVPPQFVTFAAKTFGDPPVIQVDPATGQVTPMRPGDALLETRFAGASMRTCIQVRNAPYDADVSNRDFCKALRHLNELAASAPLSQTWPEDPGGSFSFFRVNGSFFTDRFSITAPDRPVGLGQPVQIPVRLSGGKVRSIFFRQWMYNNGRDIAIPANATDANGASLSDGVLTAVAGGETGKFIEIVPLALGNLEIGIAVVFEDGGFAERFFRMKVVPSSLGLQFFRGDALDRLRLALDQKKDQSEEGDPQATQLCADVGYKGVLTGSSYDGIQNAIRLSGLEGVKFTIQQPPGPPVIEVNEKGWVRALHAGDAVVIADFAGMKWEYPFHIADAPKPSSASH